MPAQAAPLSQEGAQHYGPNGVVVETGTTAVTGDFYLLMPLVDTVIASMSENGASGDSMATSVKAGVPIFNSLGITAFTLTSGAVRAYRR